MTQKYLGQVHSVDELFRLIDRDRLAAAKVIGASFEFQVNVAIANITDISGIASAKVMADTNVASTKILIDAEVAATRLGADAELLVADFRRHGKQQVAGTAQDAVENMFEELGRNFLMQLSDGAKQSIEAIQNDAQNSIAKIKAIGNSAISAINDLTLEVSSKSQEAASLAAEKIADFRKIDHTLEEVATEAETAAHLVTEASDLAVSKLQSETHFALANIRKVTDDACHSIEEAVAKAELRISVAADKASQKVRKLIFEHISGSQSE
jgi:hypothetical protein